MNILSNLFPVNVNDNIDNIGENQADRDLWALTTTPLSTLARRLKGILLGELRKIFPFCEKPLKGLLTRTFNP